MTAATIQDRSSVVGIGFRVLPTADFNSSPSEFIFAGHKVFMSTERADGTWSAPMPVTNPDRFGSVPEGYPADTKTRRVARAWVEAFVSEWEQGCIDANHGHDATCQIDPCTC